MIIRATSVAIAFSCGVCAAPVYASDWKPIDPAHLSMKVPKIQPSAGAEALLWEVRVSDDLENGHDLTTTFQHYLRVKIFTDRGREAFATVDIPYSSGMVVKDVAARTIRPDGSIIELKDSDIYRRTILKANDLKISAVSFAVPAIEPGAIVEYRWREVFRDSLAANLRLRFSREIPVHAVRYYIRPLAIPGFSMVAWPFNGEIQPPRKQENGFHMLALDNVPGDAEETYGPPAYEQRPWVFIGYELRGRSKSPDYYEQFGKELHEEYSKRSKPNDEIRAVAASAIAGATTDGARVAALTQTAREKIRRVDIDTADPADLRNARDAKNAADALRRGIGTGDDVVLLFLAMASASGLEARVAATPSRGDLFVRSIKPHPYFMRGRVVAVRSTTGWLFADPTNEYSERGRLRWDYEDQRVLIADAREPVFAQTPPSLPAETAKKRTGTFRLLEDGTLEGEARIEYTGHWADTFREQEDHDTPAQRERDLRDSVAKRLTGAEISDIRIEHVTDLRGPYTNVYSIRVPGYAQRTGSRLFLQPAVFQKGIEAIFQAAERKADVYFPFAWSEDDAVTIELPAGFTVEQPQALPRMDIGAASYESSVVTEARRLSFRRKVAIGENGIFFAVAHYRPLRAFFDALHRADATTVVLRRSDGSQ